MDDLVKELRETSEHYAEASQNATADLLDQAATFIEELNAVNIGLSSKLFGTERERGQLLCELTGALEDIRFWSSYASEYFQKKHDLESDIKRIESVLAKHAPERT
jgi:hypothetical protein